jgi:subtilisin-like proprotein convertase family protein
VVVAADLLGMKQGRGKNGLWSLEIPADHSEAWLTTLNALRLTLAGEHSFTDEELSHQNPPDLSTARGLALMQVNFYAFIQECLLRALEENE